MSRVQVKSAPTARKVIREIANSEEMAAALRPLADRILQAAARDPNPRYVSTLRIRPHRSRGPFGRVSWRVGCSIPSLGARVEAERGTLSRALGAAGV